MAAKWPASIFKGINPVVFWPPFLLLITAVVLNSTNQAWFSKQTELAQDLLLTNFGWLFSLCAFGSVVLCFGICFSKFGNIRIGGVKAEPLMAICLAKLLSMEKRWRPMLYSRHSLCYRLLNKGRV